MLILGIDDAGRGPLIGNMFLAGVLLKSGQESMLKAEGVADSKQLAHAERIRLAALIREHALKTCVVAASPEQIDHAVLKGLNLNTLEAIKTVEIIHALAGGKKEKIKIIVDCPSTNVYAWRSLLLSMLKQHQHLELHCEHKADVHYPAVSAASILAKVVREEHVAELKKQHGEFGSGYPADPLTQAFLKKEGKRLADSGIFRKSWSTWKALFPQRGQVTLGEF